MQDVKPQPPREGSPRRRRARYALPLLFTALLTVSGALAAFRLALEYSLGPLEGLPVGPDGALLPEAPLRVGLVQTAPCAAGSRVDAGEERLAWEEALEQAGLSVVRLSPEEIPERGSTLPVVILPWDSRLTPAQARRLPGYVRTGGGLLVQGRLCELEDPLEQTSPIGQTSPIARGTASLAAKGNPVTTGSSADKALTAPAPSPGTATSSPTAPAPGQAEPALPTSLEASPLFSSLLDVQLSSPIPASAGAQVAAQADQAGLLSHLLPAGEAFRVSAAVLNTLGASALKAGDGPAPQAAAPGPGAGKTEPVSSEILRWNGMLQYGDSGVPVPIEGTALRVGARGSGRVAWLGLPLSQLEELSGQASLGSRLVGRLLPWLGQRPVLDRPGLAESARQRIHLGVQVEELEGARWLASRLGAQGLRATFFLPPALVEAHPAVVRELGAVGELGLLGSERLAALGNADQARWLREGSSGLKAARGGLLPGLLPWPGTDSTRLREAALQVGMRYLVPETKALRFAPLSWSWKRLLPEAPSASSLLRPSGVVPRQPLLLAARPDIDLRPGVLPPARDGGASLPLKALDADQPQAGQRLVLISSRTAAQPSGQASLEALLQHLATPSHFLVEPLGDALDEWQAVSECRLEARLLDRRRLHVRVATGALPLGQLSLRVFLPSGLRPDRLVSHRLRAPHSVLRSLPHGRVGISLTGLGAAQIHDLFLYLQPDK